MFGLFEGAEVGVAAGRGVLVGRGVSVGPATVGTAVGPAVAPTVVGVACTGATVGTGVGVSGGASGEQPPSKATITTATVKIISHLTAVFQRPAISVSSCLYWGL